MCNTKKENTLLVIENGLTTLYSLDNRLEWNLGRTSTGNSPQVPLHLPTVSRKHGRFVNIDGYWFFFNESDERRTTYNGQYVKKAYAGRKRPIMLRDMDCLVYGSTLDDLESVNNVVSFYFEKTYEGGWKTVDTKGKKRFAISCDGISEEYQNPMCGILLDSMNGRVIYMGDYSYVTGDVELKGL